MKIYKHLSEKILTIENFRIAYKNATKGKRHYEEVRKIVNECYKKATKILKDNKDLVMLLSNTLIEKETITKEEIDELF